MKREKIPSSENNIEKLIAIEKELAEKLRGEGVPVDDECRISMESFFGFYSKEEIDRDLNFIKKREREWYGSLDKEGIRREKMKHDGEKLEVLKTIIFNKFIGDDFIIVRSSNYDDYKNNIDNVILNKKTGELVCALDEVSSMSGKEYEDKVEKILSRNLSDKGVYLKYGLDMESEKVKISFRDRLPLFYIALSSERLRDAMANIGNSIEEKTDYERKLFLFFLTTLEGECYRLDLSPGLDLALRAAIKSFRKTLEQIKSRL